MVTTRWRKQNERSGRSQRSMAKALSVNITEMNMVAQGRAFLTPDKFKLALDLLGVGPAAIYDADTLALIYGMGVVKTVVKKPRGSQVRLDPDVQERVNFVAEDEHLTKAQAANAIIRRAFETRRIEA